MTQCVTKAMLIHFIEGKHQIKNHKTYLTNHTGSILCYILVINSLRPDTSVYVHVHTHRETKAISRNRAHMPGLTTGYVYSCHMNLLKIFRGININTYNFHGCPGQTQADT